MHEFSLIREVLSQVSELAGEHGGQPVERIVLRLGALSGFDATLVHSAFEMLQEDSPWASTDLVIQEIPFEIECRACQMRHRPIDVDFRCPKCGVHDTKAVSGEEVLLDSIELAPVTEQAPQ